VGPAVVEHVAPRTIWLCQLGKPDVTCLAGESAGFKRTHNRFLVADFSAFTVCAIATALYLGRSTSSNIISCFTRKRAINDDQVADGYMR